MNRRHLFLSVYYVLFCFVTNENFFIPDNHAKLFFKNDSFSLKLSYNRLYTIIREYAQGISFDEQKFIQELKSLEKSKRNSYRKLKRNLFQYLNAEDICTHDIDLFGCIYKLNHGFDLKINDQFMIGIVDFLSTEFDNIILKENMAIQISSFKKFTVGQMPDMGYVYTSENFKSDLIRLENAGYITRDDTYFYFTEKFVEAYKKSFFYEFDDSVKHKFGIKLLVA
ncbi:MAG: hypothetical protein Q4D02_05295 [Clostridia bacterium]|nr:hypothetical protein [Clostridia bacterium]